MLWACIHLPQLALDAVLRRTPDPDRPLALVSGPAHLRHLHAVNETAAQAGLKPGMRLSAAHALLSDVALVEHDASADARWQRFLAAWAYRHSSQVSAQWPGAIVLEVRARSEEHTSELQSLMRISYSVFLLKKKNHCI